MPHEKCDWGTCWNLYGKLLTKRDMKFKGTASDDFHSQNHWESKCIETDAPEDNFKGPSVGEVIGVIVNNPKKPAKDPTDDLEPIVVDERMKDDVKELLEDEFLEEDDDLIVVDDTDPVVDPTPVDPEPVVDPTPVNPTPVDPAVCHKTTPPDACACIQKYDKASWKRGQVNDVIKAIGQCVCDLENGPLEPGEPFPLVTKAGRMNCMRRSLQTMRELGGGFACKLQKYEGHGNKQRCHSHYPMADVEGEKARKTFNPK